MVLTKGEGRSIWLLGDLYTFKFKGEALSVTELTAFPQNGPPPHIHLREDESFWVLDGEFSVLLGERTLTPGQGAFVHVPKGALHTYKNIGSTPQRNANFSRISLPESQRKEPKDCPTTNASATRRT